MIPPPSDPCWRRIVTGDRPISSSFVALNMFVFNTRLKYRQDSERQAALADRVYQFVAKYEKSLKQEDLQALGL